MIDKIENCLVGVGLTMGIANIESILGVTLLIVQLIIIIGKCITKIIDKCKTKDYNGIEEDLEKTQDEINDYIKRLEDIKAKGGKNNE